MKKVVCFILYSTLIFTFSKSFAIDIEYNTESNVKKAILVENYVIWHKEKINKYLADYNLLNSPDLSSDLKSIDELIKALRKIENTNIEKKKAEDVIQVVLDRIKIINESLRIKLQKEKDNYEKKLNQKKQAYAVLWIKISDKIYNINLKIAKNIIKNETLTVTELKIKTSLIILNKESQKLRNFWDLEFKSESEIKRTFIEILKKIKKEIDLMNQELR